MNRYHDYGTRRKRKATRTLLPRPALATTTTTAPQPSIPHMSDRRRCIGGPADPGVRVAAAGEAVAPYTSASPLPLLLPLRPLSFLATAQMSR